MGHVAIPQHREILSRRKREPEKDSRRAPAAGSAGRFPARMRTPMRRKENKGCRGDEDRPRHSPEEHEANAASAAFISSTRQQTK